MMRVFITPNATSIFYNVINIQSSRPKDLELRFYSNHEDALKFGKKSAEKSISTVALTIGGHVRSEKYLYDAYVLKGNSILLCQKFINHM